MTDAETKKIIKYLQLKKIQCCVQSCKLQIQLTWLLSPTGRGRLRGGLVSLCSVLRNLREKGYVEPPFSF